MQKASLEIDKAKAELARRGFYVSIARMAGSQPYPVNGDAYSVLVIEDDPYLARTYEQLLAMMNCRATLVGNRVEIESALKVGTNFDLILLDLNLPDIGGFNILHLLSSHETLGATPVIVVSSDTSKESIIRALTLGADGYVTKPITVDNLTDSIRSVVGLPAAQTRANDPWAGAH
jgi:DNA-binding response OmpR family regulator